MTSKTVKTIIVLPTFGAPFVYANKLYNTKDKAKKEELARDVAKVVGGNDVAEWTQSESNHFFVHPLFVREDPRWAYAEKILKKKGIKIFCNDNGMNECSPNMALPVRHKDFSGLSVISKETFDRLPLVIRNAPMFGNLAIVVPVCDIKVPLQSLCLLSEQWARNDDGWYDPYEPYDDEEMEAKMKDCKEKGYDTSKTEGTGQIYQSSIVGDE